MSEEVKTTEAAAADATPAKKKKINKLTLKELKSKISEIEEKNLSHSNYYKQLTARLKEMEGQA